jgi:hypothetical protein
MVTRLHWQQFVLGKEIFQDPVDLCLYRSASRTQLQIDLTCRLFPTADGEQWVRESCNFQHLRSPFILQTNAYSEEIVEGVNQLLIFTEEITGNLALELELRKASREYYSLQEVATLLANCLEALWLMNQSSPYCHGHFTPSSVYNTASGWKIGYFHSQMWRNMQDPHYPEYKHPAIRKGEETEGGWADLYALGVLMSHICTLSEPEVFKHVELLDCQRAYIALQTAIAEKYPGSVVRVVSSLLAVSRKLTLPQMYDQLTGKMSAVWSDLQSTKFPQSVTSSLPLQPCNYPYQPNISGVTSSLQGYSVRNEPDLPPAGSIQLTCPHCLHTQTRSNQPPLHGFLCSACRRFTRLSNPSDFYPAPKRVVLESTL